MTVQVYSEGIRIIGGLVYSANRSVITLHSPIARIAWREAHRMARIIARGKRVGRGGRTDIICGRQVDGTAAISGACLYG